MQIEKCVRSIWMRTTAKSVWNIAGIAQRQIELPNATNVWSVEVDLLTFCILVDLDPAKMNDRKRKDEDTFKHCLWKQPNSLLTNCVQYIIEN